MKKALSLTLAVCLLSVVVFGCAGGAPKGPTDQELLQAKTQACVEAANAKDIDKLLTFYSEKFVSFELGDKAAFKAFLLQAKDSGFLDGVVIDAKQAKTTIQGDKATIEPVSVKGSFGTGEASFTVTKENGQWMITGMEVSGI